MKFSEQTRSVKQDFLKGGFEASEVIASIDWINTSLGDLDEWPQSLKTTLGILLNAKLPMLLFWGAEQTCFYNDAFHHTLGNKAKHPSAMGKPGKDVWPEKWNNIKPAIDSTFLGAQPDLQEDQQVAIYKSGKLEETYWTFCYSAVRNENDEIAGVLLVCNETSEKIRALKRFENYEKRFLDIVDQTPVGIAIFMGAEFVFTAANKTYLDLIDRKLENVLYRPMFDVLPEMERIARPIVTKVFKTGETFSGYEFPTNLKRSGKTELAFFNFIYQPLFFDGEIKGAILVTNDVTQMVRSKKQLAENEGAFRDYINAAPTPFAIYIGAEMRIKMANEAILKVWDKDKSVIGKTLREILPDLEVQPFYQVLENVFKTGIQYHTNEEKVEIVRGGNSHVFYFNFTYTPLKNEKGVVYGVLHIATDITEQVLSKQKLIDAEERVRIAMEAGDLASFDLNLLTGETHATTRFFRIFGLDHLIPQEESVKMVLPEDRHIRSSAYQRAFNDPNGKLFYDVRIKWKDGSIHWIRNQARVFFDDNGKPLRLLGTLKDVSAEKNAQQRLEESEKHFRSLIQESPVPKALLRGKDYTIEIANDAMLKLWNKSSDVIGQPLIKALPELAGQLYIEPLAEVYSTGIIYKENEQPAYIETPEGQLKKFYLNLIFKRITSYYKEGFDILMTSYDVTPQVISRKRVEESEKELQRINQRLEIALDAARLGSYELDFETGYINSTPQCKANYGFSADMQFNLPDLMRQLTPHYRDMYNAGIEEAIKNKTVFNCEYPVTWPDGSTHWIRTAGKVTYNEDEKAVTLVGVNLDITQNKLALQRVEESEQRLNMALEYTNTGSFDLNLHTFEVIYTPRLGEIFGHPPNTQLTYAQMRSHVHPEDLKSIVEKAFSSAIKTGSYFYEARIIKKDKTARWIRTQGRVMYDIDGIPMRIVGTIMDITEEKNEQQRKDDFMGIVTHELKTPLTSVKGFAQFLHERALSANDRPSAALLNKMVSQINKLNVLVQDLLDIARMEGGKMKFQQVVFDFHELISEVIEQVSITTTKRIETQFADWNGSIIGDRDRTGQVLINLLTNAIKYSPEADRVIVTVEHQNKKVICSVTDFGIGISKDSLPYIFDRFYREAEAQVSTFPGLGLGLYISAEIIKRQNGEIWVQSEKGKGSVFSFSLPLNR